MREECRTGRKPTRFYCGDAIRRYRLNSDLRAPKVHFCTFSPGTNPQLPRDVLGWTNCAQGKRNVRETNQSPEGEHHGRSLSRYRRRWPKRLGRDGAGYRLYVRPPQSAPRQPPLCRTALVHLLHTLPSVIPQPKKWPQLWGKLWPSGGRCDVPDARRYKHNRATVAPALLTRA